MPKERKYEIKEEMKEITADKVKEKIGKESLSAAEIAAYLEEYGLDGHTYSEKTVKNYIKTLCEASEGLLHVEDFRENPSKKNSPYVVKPACQRILLALMKSDLFDGRKNDRILATRENLYRQLLSNIELILDVDEQKIIKKDSSYMNALLESGLSERINHELIALLRCIYHADNLIRPAMMSRVLDKLISLRKWAEHEIISKESIKMVYQYDLDDEKNSEYEKRLFDSRNLPEFMIALLAYEMKGEKVTDDNRNDAIGLAAFSLAAELFKITGTGPSAALDLLEEMDRKIADEERFKAIKKKAEEILDLNDPLEKVIYCDILRLVKTIYLRPYVEEEECRKMVRLTESAIADDLYNILNRFLTEDDFSSPTLQLLKKIKTIRKSHGAEE